MSKSPARKPDARAAPASSSRSHRPLPPGTMLENRYEILRVIGRGGMSTVYAARDHRFGQVERITAIKEMVDQDPDPGTRALRLVNFERESALLATIAHASVPKIYDYFSHGGLVYLVLEYIDGTDLERALLSRKAPFPERDLLRWTLEICSVLKTLHNNEPDPIIFRDLKPSNIMLRTTGNIALIDFGIARVFQGSQRGTMIGTEGYAPPEQYRGIADARGDIYALGATLHHLATNSDPRQETPFTFHERPVRVLNPDISERFASIISKMVSYHPDQRYQTVEEIEYEIERLIYGSGQIRTPMFPGPPPAATPSPQGDDQPAQPGTVVFTGNVQSPAVRPQTVLRRRSARKRRARLSNRFEEPRDRTAWSVRTADEVRGTGRFDGERVLIGSYDQHLYAIDPLSGTVRWKFPTGGGVVARPMIAGDLVVVGSEDGMVYGVKADSGALSWSCRTGRPVRSSACLVDGGTIIGSDDGSLYHLDIATGDVVWQERLWAPVRSSPVAHEEAVFVGCDNGYIYAVDSATGNVRWWQPCGGPVRSAPVVAGERVIVSSWYGLISAFSVSNGVRAWQHSFDAELAASPALRNETIAIGVADGALVGLSIHEGEKLWEVRYANQITSTALLGKTFGYVGTVDGDVLAFEIESGELSWKHRIGGPIVSSPVLAGEVLVVGSLDGQVYGVLLTDEELADLEG